MKLSWLLSSGTSSQTRWLRLSCLLLSVVALGARPSASQNLLLNPGFDTDLSGWTIRIGPSGSAGASAAWVASDVDANPLSGGVALHASADFAGPGGADAEVGQCILVAEGNVLSFGARFVIRQQLALAKAAVKLTFFRTADCSGTVAGSAGATATLPGANPPPIVTGSGGLWLLATSQALAPAGIRSLQLDVGVQASSTSYYGPAFVDAVGDAAFLYATPVDRMVSILPSAAWAHGAGGSYWHTALTLVNPGTSDAQVTLKWLGHDADGRPGRELAYSVRAGETLALDEREWERLFPEDWGAIRMTSSPPSVVLESETSTLTRAGGTVGQRVAAMGSLELVGELPQTIAPIEENDAFRTNLVLANASDQAVTAHVALYAADGTPLGARDVALPPLGMTQLSRVGSLLGATALHGGRLAVSTRTPGGFIATYASVIDNTTNDPRTLLPR